MCITKGKEEEDIDYVQTFVRNYFLTNPHRKVVTTAATTTSKKKKLFQKELPKPCKKNKNEQTKKFF